jgi:hypothetical protein
MIGFSLKLRKLLFPFVLSLSKHECEQLDMRFFIVEISSAIINLNRVLAPEGEILSFASPKESIQRKGGPLPLAFCASRLRRELIEGTSLYLDKRDSFMNRPYGVLPS